MSSERRVARMREVLGGRLGHLRAAIEAVYHRHNVSAILRTCDALGIHQVHLVGGGGEIRAHGPARGAERWLALHAHRNAEDAVRQLRADGFRIYVADLVGEPLLPETVPIDAPLCLWFGAELVGVSEVARAAADGVVTIPMHGMAQSLNVSVAAALALRPVAERVRARGEAVLLDAATRGRQLATWVERDRMSNRDPMAGR